ncbi:MAG: hypothetical protein OCD02_04830 [Spirochaetaceae bacterium]
MIIPNYLTRIAPIGEYPFVSLNEISIEEANSIKKKHCKRNNIGDFYADDEYLLHRREIEHWIYKSLKDKGGTPQSTVPVYMILGEPKEGETDIRIDIQKNGIEYRIEINEIDISTISFTYPDSMYELEYDEEGHIIGGRRTNNPKVYLYNELEELIIQKKVLNYEFYIEAQVWDNETLQKIWNEKRYKVI